MLDPLRQYCGNGRSRQWLFLKQVVIVVDGPDQCDNPSDTAAVVELLALGATADILWLQLLLISRLEMTIRKGIENILIASHEIVFLQHFDPPSMERDISIFLSYKLH